MSGNARKRVETTDYFSSQSRRQRGNQHPRFIRSSEILRDERDAAMNAMPFPRSRPVEVDDTRHQNGSVITGPAFRSCKFSRLPGRTFSSGGPTSLYLSRALRCVFGLALFTESLYFRALISTHAHTYFALFSCLTQHPFTFFDGITSSTSSLPTMLLFPLLTLLPAHFIPARLLCRRVHGNYLELHLAVFRAILGSFTITFSNNLRGSYTRLMKRENCPRSFSIRSTRLI